MNNQHTILSWGNGIRRSQSLAHEHNLQDIQISYTFKNKLLKPINYIINTFKTISVLFGISPSRIIVTAPPTLILHAVFLYKFICRNKANVIVDCHNGVLRKEWRKIPCLKYLLSKCELVLSHNDVVKKDIDTTFQLHSVVLSDPLIKFKTFSDDKSKITALIEHKINVLVPVSYADDEPIADIVKAAATLKDSHNFILTGRYTKQFSVNEKLDGISFTGYISSQQYIALLHTCDLVLCLTKDNNIQMCALIESISLMKNVVCTDNTVNRQMFSPYEPVYTSTNAVDITAAVVKEVQLNEALENKRKHFVATYMKQWNIKAKEVFYGT